MFGDSRILVRDTHAVGATRRHIGGGLNGGIADIHRVLHQCTRLCLSVLAVMLFDKVLQENPSLKIGWLGFISAAVVGVYSIPTTLMAIAGVFAWMLLSTLADGEVSKRKGTSKKIALARLAIAMLSVLLFVRLLLVRGPGAAMAKDVVSWQQDREAHGQCARLHWTERVPGGVLWILFGGLAIGLLFRCKVCEHRVSGHSVSMSMALWLSAAIFAWGVPRFRFSSGCGATCC